MKPTILLLAGFGLAIALTPATAEIYKSVDERGNVEYSDTPAGSARVEAVEVAPGPSRERIDAAKDEVRRLNEKVDRMSEERRERRSEQQASKRSAKEQREACDAARKAVEEIESVPPNRRLIIDPDGTARRVSWEEYQQHIEQLRQREASACEGLR
jgi:outer membrane murein-binding lipoprotein Lpp